MNELATKENQTNEGKQEEGALKDFGGSRIDGWNVVLLDQALNSLWTGNSPEDKRDSQWTATGAALKGIKPENELEGMMAAQLIAAHNATMECFRRAMMPEQTNERRHETLNQANKLSRTFATMVGALDKHRGKAQQKMTVEHVHVYAGGQAVVGTIEHAGGAYGIIEDQPHAKQITYASQPSLWGENASEDALPIPCDGEWSLPNAWG